MLDLDLRFFFQNISINNSESQIKWENIMHEKTKWEWLTTSEPRSWLTLVHIQHTSPSNMS